ncbi:hypothetical protein KUTeg_012344 [Tegillarca granosa]|uniref:Tr-type G domain-containing protein n=1 Tax=Tegillarca granosa TaxID=220873 RepID=A0ABQ9EZ88_TEGGR|nr:hypothetical protein KUTeg_012344 [Tegillarca granosa]
MEIETTVEYIGSHSAGIDALRTSVTFGGVQRYTPETSNDKMARSGFSQPPLPPIVDTSTGNSIDNDRLPDITFVEPSRASAIRTATSYRTQSVIMGETPRLPPVPQNRANVTKPYVNVVFIGHVDAGKSTLIGHLTYKCDVIDEATMNRLANEADAAGKSSYKYAWVMDKLKAEREKGISIDSKMRKFDSIQFEVVVIDAPGHHDYADVAVLVVSAVKGEFEEGMRHQGQTREHLQLAYTLGVRQLIVAVNKMDATEPAYDETRYTQIEHLVTLLAKKCGYDSDTVIFIPVSAWEGDNLTQLSDKMSWFKSWKIKRRSGGASGQSLLEAIDNSEKPTRMATFPLRIPIHTVYKLGNIGIVAAGKIHSGKIKPNMQLMFAPNNLKTKIRAVQVFREVMDEGRCGDTVGLQIENLSLKDIKKGDVCGEIYKDPPQKVDNFTAQIFVLNRSQPFKKGYTPIIHCHTAMVACKVTDIRERTDRRTGYPAEHAPSVLSSGQMGVVDFEATKPLSVDTFFEYPSMGRIVIRETTGTVAVGVVVYIPGRDIADDFKMRNQRHLTEMSHYGMMSRLLSRPDTTATTKL